MHEIKARLGEVIGTVEYEAGRVIGGLQFRREAARAVEIYVQQLRDADAHGQDLEAVNRGRTDLLAGAAVRAYEGVFLRMRNPEVHLTRLASDLDKIAAERGRRYLNTGNQELAEDSKFHSRTAELLRRRLPRR